MKIGLFEINRHNIIQPGDSDEVILAKLKFLGLVIFNTVLVAWMGVEISWAMYWGLVASIAEFFIFNKWKQARAGKQPETIE